MTLPSGAKLGRYEIRSKIGEGGMGEVYLAQDTKLGRKIALKILPAHVAAQPDRMKRFVHEAKAASALNHPNIITIHEIDETDSINFIATEFIDGETLRGRMRNAPLKLAEVLDVAAQVASALSAAHAAGIVHRDIKPENVMIRRDGIVKVLDFGLAKLTEQSLPALIDTEALTRAVVKTDPGVVMGTTIYMSPEQARGLLVDERTDIWSLGVVIYELIAGVAPFSGQTTSDTIASILKTQPQRLSGLVADVPTEIERIISKALEKEAEDRYQTSRDLLVDLRQLKKRIDFEAELERSHAPEVTTDNQQVASATRGVEPANPTSSAEYIVSHIRQHKRAFTAATLAVLVAAVIFGYWFITRSSTSEARINSIAVLPFVNASGNPDVEYLSDGMTESLINSLSQLPQLSVKARSSVFRYKGKEVEPQQIGAALSVQAILNGHFTQHSDDLTLSLSLVDARTGNQIWGQQYNRKLTDLVSLQSEIARDVSQKLRVLSGTDKQKLTKNYTANVDAYQLYLKGRYHVLKLTLPEIQTGISFFQQAIAIDPSYALAYVGLADGYRSTLVGDVPSTEFLPKAKTAAQKAIEIDDSLADAHAELGFIIFWYDWDWNAAENQFKRALEFDPNNADAHLFYAHLLSCTGRHVEALAEVKRALELDPLNLRTNALEGQFLVHAGRTDEALASLQKTFELDPNSGFAHYFASSAYIEKGMFPEAIAEARKAKELTFGAAHAASFLGYALAKSGKQAEARTVLEELLKRSAERYISPYNIALIYNGLDERDQTLAWLERGYEQRDQKMVFLKVEPKWNNLRADRRFQDLLRRVGFTP